MQQQTAHTIAQRLLNLYRQAHVIRGGWMAVNQVLINESKDPRVMEELEKLPTGKRLSMHISNLKSGKTPMNTIDKDLLPYGGLIMGQDIIITLNPNELSELRTALASFEPTPDELNKIKKLSCIKKFGNDWMDSVKSALNDYPDLSAKWLDVVRTERAYNMWNIARQLVSEDLTERDRARIQTDMPDFETYLPMFGEPGKEVLAKLRTFMSSVAPVVKPDK